MKISKIDKKLKMVFGFFNINKIGDDLVVDLDGDMIPTEELEKAAYNFVLDARIMGQDHVIKGVGRLAESIMFTYEKQQSIEKSLRAKGIPASINLGCEGWFGGFKVDDEEVWESVENGERPEFSIGGNAKRIPAED